MIYILLPIFLGVCVFMVCTVCWMEQSCIFHEFSRIFRTWMHSINNYSRRFRLPRHSLFVVSKKYTWAIIIIMIKLPTTFYHDKILQHLPFFYFFFLLFSTGIFIQINLIWLLCNLVWSALVCVSSVWGCRLALWLQLECCYFFKYII